LDGDRPAGHDRRRHSIGRAGGGARRAMIRAQPTSDAKP
jgi:hypothetical protein